jgi:uncharacterized protein
MRYRLAAITTLWLVMTGVAIARSAAAEQPALEGTWIGWAWLGDAGDLPLRVHFSVAGNGIEAALDSPAHRAFGIPLVLAREEAPAIRLEGESRSGSRITISGEPREGVIAGTIRWAEYEGTVELIRSPRPIANVPLETYADAAGLYERAPGDLVELRARPWGELLYRELRTGRVRTLLPLETDHFFLGGAVYLPDPVEADLRLIRDDLGIVTALEEMLPDGSMLSAGKIELVHELLSFTSGDVTLSGTLLRRTDRAPAPAVVMLGGSDWKTREDVSFHARTLATLGFAVLSFDRRGHGESEGQPLVPFATTAGDAIAAVGSLRARDDVDGARVGVFGMSRGGWQAPLAATMSDDVAFLILLVPPAVSPAAQETRSRLDQMKRDGFQPREIELAERLLELTWEWIRKGDNWDEYTRLRGKAVAAAIPDYVIEGDSPEPDAWAWARMNMFFEPCPILGKLSLPVLAIFASDDLHVSEPVNRSSLSECIGEKADLSVHVIAGAGHDLSIPNDLPIHRQTGRGDEGYSIIAEWAGRFFCRD